MRVPVVAPVVAPVVVPIGIAPVVAPVVIPVVIPVDMPPTVLPGAPVVIGVPSPVVSVIAPAAAALSALESLPPHAASDTTVAAAIRLAILVMLRIMFSVCIRTLRATMAPPVATHARPRRRTPARRARAVHDDDMIR